MCTSDRNCGLCHGENAEPTQLSLYLKNGYKNHFGQRTLEAPRKKKRHCPPLIGSGGKFVPHTDINFCLDSGSGSCRLILDVSCFGSP